MEIIYKKEKDLELDVIKIIQENEDDDGVQRTADCTVVRTCSCACGEK